ncbi:MAG: hypothetical protein AAF547_24820, partial [Actinomycetota bacterium]
LLDRVGLERALVLQSVYYVGVVVFEVPSGWISDRFGRVLTLRLVAVSWIAAHLLFLIDGGAPTIVAAQILLALGYASLSGTDSTFHFETLEALGRVEEFGPREAAARRGLFRVTAGTALAGGLLGAIDLRLPFAAAALAAGLQLVAAFGLVEPALDREPRSRPVGFIADLGATVTRLRDPLLTWLAAFVIAQVVIVHLGADLAAPYIQSIPAVTSAADGTAAAVIGGLAAAVALVGATAAGRVPDAVRRFGLRTTLIAAALIPLAGLAGMAAGATLLVLPLLALRSVPGAVNSVVVPSLVGARVPGSQRATLLSVISLGGRLGYACALLGLASLVRPEAERYTLVGAVAAAAMVAVLVLTVTRLRSFPARLDHEHAHHHDAIEHEHVHSHDDGHHGHAHLAEHLAEGIPTTGPHRHRHRHTALWHQHVHSRDDHHDHEHP